MNSKSTPTQIIEYFHLYLLVTTSEKIPQTDAIVDIFIFLLHYSFLLNDATNTKKSCDSKTTQLNATQGNIYMGARYLDPKYSRWISVDPALGEYIPGAGKANARDAGRLPGMGGLFNSVNLSLFHYAGNNPVRYTDPTGMAAYDEFDSIDAAAKDWAKTYADDSIVQGNEMGSSIFMMVKDGKVKFFYNIPYEGTLIENRQERILKKTCDINRSIDDGHEKEGATVFLVSTIHSHANWDPRFNDENPSSIDKQGVMDCSTTNRFYARREYVVTPGGFLKEFDKNGVTRVVSSNIVRDIRQDMPKWFQESKYGSAVIEYWANQMYHEDEYYPYGS